MNTVKKIFLHSLTVFFCFTTFINTAQAVPITFTGNALQIQAESLIKDALSATNLGQILNVQKSLEEKEYVLDAIAGLNAKQTIQQLTGDALKRLGGQLPGQNGQIPFVQNYANWYERIADRVAAEYAFGPEISNLCSERESFEVRSAQFQRYVNTYKNTDLKCTRPETQGSQETYVHPLERALDMFTNGNDDPVRAYLKSEVELYTRMLDAQENEKQAVDYGRGMLPQKVCKTIKDPDGYSRQVCNIVSPPSLQPDATSFALGELPALGLLNIDEFNEVVSSFLSNLTNQALGSFGGVLGLSGNSEYSNNVYGEGGNQSYVDAMLSEDISNYQTVLKNPIKEAITIEKKYASLQQKIVDEVTALEKRLGENAEEFPNCFELELTDELKAAKATSTQNLTISSTTLAILTVLDEQFELAKDAATKNAVLSTFTEYKDKGFFRTEYGNRELEFSYINLTFAQMIDKFKYDTAVARFDCGGNFDYEGVLSYDDEDQEDEDDDS
jgi:hypothetical protein